MTRRTLAEDAGRLALHMSRVRDATLESGIVALLDAGVPLDDIEVVYETYSDPSEEGYIVHQRAYVRRAKKPATDPGGGR